MPRRAGTLSGWRSFLASWLVAIPAIIATEAIASLFLHGLPDLLLSVIGCALALPWLVVQSLLWHHWRADA
jgi:hypothetical protein